MYNVNAMLLICMSAMSATYFNKGHKIAVESTRNIAI